MCLRNKLAIKRGATRKNNSDILWLSEKWEEKIKKGASKFYERDKDEREEVECKNATEFRRRRNNRHNDSEIVGGGKICLNDRVKTFIDCYEILLCICSDFNVALFWQNVCVAHCMGDVA